MVQPYMPPGVGDDDVTVSHLDPSDAAVVQRQVTGTVTPRTPPAVSATQPTPRQAVAWHGKPPPGTPH